ncbi:MAG: NPCBM/NEW2 domain-containing protein [Pirellulaceae bacterium]|nr:NPCBM/NEW2 domain-containing protein [Pirellulaceae bacterium]
MGRIALTLIALLGATFVSARANDVVRVVPLAGETIEAKLVALSATNVSVGLPSGTQQLAATDLLAVEFPSPGAIESEEPAVWITLVDGSRLHVENYAAADGKASITLKGGLQVTAPTRSVTSVRYRAQDPSVANLWQAIVAAPHTSDLIVVRKTSTREVEEAGETRTVTETILDQLDGTLLGVEPANVNFEFGGDKLQVSREKIEGLVYFHPVRRELSVPACQLIDTSGSRWSLRAVELVDGKLRATTVAGVTAELPLDAVAKIDFSVGNVLDLAELEPDAGTAEPVVSLQPAAMSTSFGRLFKRGTQPPLGAEAFQIGGKRFTRGLALHSPQTLVYRVPEGFRKFHAVAGIDDSTIAPGHFVLQILGDGKELFRQEFSPDSPREPLPIRLDLSGVRRLSIVMDPADGQDIGDQLNLCEARLSK